MLAVDLLEGVVTLGKSNPGSPWGYFGLALIYLGLVWVIFYMFLPVVRILGKR